MGRYNSALPKSAGCGVSGASPGEGRIKIHGLPLAQPVEFQRPVKIALQRRCNIEQQILLRRGGGNGNPDFHDGFKAGNELALK